MEFIIQCQNGNRIRAEDAEDVVVTPYEVMFKSDGYTWRFNHSEILGYGYKTEDHDKITFVNQKDYI